MKTVMGSNGDTPPRTVVGARYMMDGRVYEIINLTPELVSLRDVDGKRAQYMAPTDFELQVLKKEITLYQLAPLQESVASAFLQPTEPRVIAAARKNYYVVGLHKAFSGALPRAASKAEIKRLADLRGDPHPPSYSAVCSWSRRYRKYNGSPCALLKLKSHRPRGKLTPPDETEIIRRYVKEVYLSDQKNSVAHVHRLIRGQIIHDNILRRENNAKTLVVPSLSTLHRYIQRQCRLRQDSCRLGESAAQKRNKFGIQWEIPKKLLEQVELDCTPLDIMLVNDDGELIGHLGNLQVAIDIRSEKVIAHDLSLTPPCAEKTLRCLKMALTAVPGEELERGKPQELVVDNGTEVANDSIKVAANVLGISLRFVPPDTPDAKPHIERFNETLNTSFIHTLPGTTFSNPVDRGDYDSEGKARYTISQLRAYFIEWLEGYYHNHPHAALNMSPNERWDRDMKQSFPPQKYSKHDLDRLLRSVVRRTINHGRVTYQYLTWTGPGLAEMEQRLKPRQKAIIYYDPTNLEEVFVALPDRPDELFRATGTRPDYQKNLTLYEHLQVREQLNLQDNSYSENTAAYALWQLRQKLVKDAQEFEVKRRKNIKSSRKSSRKACPNAPAEPPEVIEHDQIFESDTTEEQEDQETAYETFYLSDTTTHLTDGATNSVPPTELPAHDLEKTMARSTARPRRD